MSSSKLSVLCDTIIEAGWLAAVSVVPLFVGGYSKTDIDVDKVALLRSIASVMIAAWLIKWIEERVSHRSQKVARRLPLVLPALLVIGTYLLATLTSIAPRLSLFGSFYRAQGTYTLLSYIVVFAMILQGLRTRPQLDRLIFTIILTSLPIALYGMMQKYSADPQTQTGLFDGRPGSMLGNPIFLSAYLIMVFALTLGKWVEHARAALASRQSGRMSIAEIILTITLTLMAAIQAAAIVLSDSRGPFLGWFAGIVLFVLLLALAWQKRWLVLSAVGLGAVGVVFLIALNLPNTPLAPLRALPGLGRLGNLTNGTGEFRLFTWENAARLALPHAPIQYPEGTPDALNALRPVFGYGPDTMPLVYYQVSPETPFSRDAETDRSHNATWDVWVMTGVIGLVAYQLLFLCIFLYGFRWLGLMPTRRWRNWLVGSWFGLALAGALLALVLGQPLYLGLALPAGNVVAVILYLVVYASRQSNLPQVGVLRHADQILLAAMLAGVFAHYVESQFGIPVPPTEVLLWVFAGVFVVIGTRQVDDAILALEPQPTPSRRTVPTWVGSVASYAAISAVIVATLLYAFASIPSPLLDWLSFLWRALTLDVVLGLAAAVWIAATLFSLCGLARAGICSPHPKWWAKAILATALPIVLAAVFALGLAAHLRAIPHLTSPVERLEDVSTLAVQATGVTEYYILGLFALIFLAAFALTLESHSLPAIHASKTGLIALVPILLAAFLWINVVNLGPMRAGVAFPLAQSFDDRSDWDPAISLYKRAIRFEPANNMYFVALARAYQLKSTSASDTAAVLFSANTPVADILSLDDQRTAGLNRLDLLYAAQTMLLHARDLSPLYGDHAINLARFYQPELPVDTPSKAKLVEMADQYYVEAQRLEPNKVALWNERADFDLNYRNDPDAAIQKLDESLARDNQFVQTYLYLGKAYVAKNDLGRAIEAYEKALGADPKSAEAQSKLAYLYYRQGQTDESIAAYLKYIDLASGAQNVWEAHKNLALIYKETGDLPGAVREAKIAASLAPNQLVSQLNDWVEQLQKH